MTPARERVIVWGVGALVVIVASVLYRWLPYESAAAGIAAAWGTALVLDDRRPQ
jgi:hypothetical protein